VPRDDGAYSNRASRKVRKNTGRAVIDRPYNGALYEFLNPEAKEEAKGTVHATFLLNFFDELRRRAPAARN
jgi:hypothetical protein